MRSINEERKENDCKNIIELYIKIAKQYKSMTNKERLRVEDIIYEEYGEIEDEDIILERRLEFLISAKKKYNKGDIVEKDSDFAKIAERPLEVGLPYTPPNDKGGKQKLTAKDIRKAVKILEEHKVTKPYYIDVEKTTEVFDLLSNYNKNKKEMDKVRMK